ncbi:hypothetical protein CC86DRAFT_375153 [Ophiobolus disseminans]|uniref:Uncharacterized protein n=1 Tax=Ophiobolus disseminans TaxID=1469910 RepID=A0A6A6ZDV1_9PLEO|nr:hypothetical protein CC86DRAFT_375153 [Ophiobolus disseminans]
MLCFLVSDIPILTATIPASIFRLLGAQSQTDKSHQHPRLPNSPSQLPSTSQLPPNTFPSVLSYHTAHSLPRTRLVRVCFLRFEAFPVLGLGTARCAGIAYAFRHDVRWDLWFLRWGYRWCEGAWGGLGWDDIYLNGCDGMCWGGRVVVGGALRICVNTTILFPRGVTIVTLKHAMSLGLENLSRLVLFCGFAIWPSMPRYGVVVAVRVCVSNPWGVHLSKTRRCCWDDADVAMLMLCVMLATGMVEIPQRKDRAPESFRSLYCGCRGYP